MKLGIALSGGGIRGIAHAGVLQALKNNGINVDVIGGTSAGSMVASLYAMGYSPEEIYMLFRKNARKIIGSNTFPIISGIKTFIGRNEKTIKGFRNGKNIEELYDNIAKQKGVENIKQIKMPLVIPSVDIMESKEYIFTNKIPQKRNESIEYINDISVGKAVRASSSFPAVFDLCSVQKHAFMDGGALDNVPVEEVKRQGADKVIAVKFDSDEINEDSNVMDIVMKTIDIMGSKIAESNLEKSDYILNVKTDKTGLLEMENLDKCFEYGYNAVIENLEEIKQILK